VSAHNTKDRRLSPLLLGHSAAFCGDGDAAGDVEGIILRTNVLTNDISYATI